MGQIVIGSEFRGGQNPFSGGHNLISRLKGTVFQNLGAGPCNTVDPPLTMTVVFFGISNKLFGFVLNYVFVVGILMIRMIVYGLGTNTTLLY
jgi:hypothetical protein